MVKEFASLLTECSGSVINISDHLGLNPRVSYAHHSIAKAGLVSLTRIQALALAPRVRVNAIAPVAGETPLLKSFLGEDTPERRKKFLATIPIGRFSTPEDMGNAACFLCSNEASMITGTILEVDGGRCI